ncbi:zf-HC2 domain-containing protein [Streptomyces sp. NPDC048278]|uniref:anti-sigma factor family protein n=1 Tax=Streptomyces sp. NPDC048278 TaxID=3155809 RepID=UPI003414C251
MSTKEHESALLGAYVLGTLDEQEMRAVDEHVESCDRCREELDGLREMESALGEVPPEAFLDGPPEGGDLLLQRTLRQARSERDGEVRRRGAVLAAVAAVAAAAVLGGGVLIGKSMGGTADEVADPPQSSVSAPATLPPAGTRVASGTSTATGSRMTLRVTPAASWVRVNASVAGIPVGEHCRLVVVSKDGHREIAGSWVVADKDKGANLDGSADIAIDDVAKILVENERGTEYVSLKV